MHTLIQRFLHWLTEPDSFYAYGLIASMVILGLYLFVRLIDKVAKTSKHWDEIIHRRHNQRH